MSSRGILSKSTETALAKGLCDALNSKRRSMSVKTSSRVIRSTSMVFVASAATSGVRVVIKIEPRSNCNNNGEMMLGDLTSSRTRSHLDSCCSRFSTQLIKSVF